jgi:tRNA threonylcarbamoyladenosine biosynthesis protein TsaE
VKGVTLTLADAAAMENLGAQLARCITPGIITLSGELGTGKTTLARGLIHGLGHTAKVRSPTYTLVEPYLFDDGAVVYHLDLYRLSDPEELEWLGLRDMLAERALLLVEWPERGGGFLPAADLSIDIDYSDSGREVSLMPLTDAGQRLLAQIKPAT